MALWLIRAGAHGEYEQRFLDEGKVYLTWEGLKYNLAERIEWEGLKELLSEAYPEYSKKSISNQAGQVWAFYHRIEVGDWIVMPSKLKPAIHFGEITGDYKFAPNNEDPFYHPRKIKWIGKDIPRTNFDQDLLYSFGAFMTVCEIKRNDAENRIKAMSQNNWKSTKPHEFQFTGDEDTEIGTSIDLEEIARDQIAKLIIAKFKGHGMARLVNGILKAEGYTTYVSPAGPDKGVDLLAAPGALGFGNPRICVQVKSGDDPLDRPTLDQLIGAMQNVQAEQGLLVSWGGFKSSVEKEKASQFFRVRLWDQDNLIEQLLKHYDNLDDDLKAELPLKRIWTITTPDGDGE